jgi:hypothetical protein
MYISGEFDKIQDGPHTLQIAYNDIIALYQKLCQVRTRNQLFFSFKDISQIQDGHHALLIMTLMI